MFWNGFNRIAARKRCSVAEAVYRYNVMPRSGDPVTSPANQLFRYEARLLDIDSMEEHDSPSVGRYSVGDRVWVRHPSRRCDVPSVMGTVTRVISDQNVEVDGMSRHVLDLRLVVPPPVAPEVPEGRDATTFDDNDDESLIIDIPAAMDRTIADEEVESGDGGEETLPRRSERERRQTSLFQYVDLL